MKQRKTGVLLLVAILAAGTVTGITGILRREHAEARLVDVTDDQAIPTVAVARPELGVKNEGLVLPADIAANYEAQIHARVSGYVKMWYHDIGARVKKGDLLATIDTPDLDQQLSQAKADLASAQADEKLAALTSTRWSDLLASHAVSQQAVDEKAGDAAMRKAKATAALANVERLNALEAFRSIVAPFDGVVTARHTDIGMLISAGGLNGPELFKVADVSRMRIYVRVPQAYASRLKKNFAAYLTLPEYPDERFEARLDTTSNAVTKDSRTVLAEFIAHNDAGKLWPGSFAEAHIEMSGSGTSLRIPTSSLLFRQEGLQAAIVGPDNVVTLKAIRPGRDLGTQLEVLGGISPNDQIIESPPDALEDGDKVRLFDTAKRAPVSTRSLSHEAGR